MYNGTPNVIKIHVYTCRKYKKQQRRKREKNTNRRQKNQNQAKIEAMT